jgi:uncharacterized protein YuzE
MKSAHEIWAIYLGSKGKTRMPNEKNLPSGEGVISIISYDADVDALSITFHKTTVTTKHLAEGIAADYDSDGRLAGLEILDAQKRFGGPETMRQVELEGLESVTTPLVLHDKPAKKYGA